MRTSELDDRIVNLGRQFKVAEMELSKLHAEGSFPYVHPMLASKSRPTNSCGTQTPPPAPAKGLDALKPSHTQAREEMCDNSSPPYRNNVPSIALSPTLYPFAGPDTVLDAIIHLLFRLARVVILYRQLLNMPTHLPHQVLQLSTLT